MRQTALLVVAVCTQIDGTGLPACSAACSNVVPFSTTTGFPSIVSATFSAISAPGYLTDHRERRLGFDRPLLTEADGRFLVVFGRPVLGRLLSFFTGRAGLLLAVSLIAADRGNAAVGPANISGQSLIAESTAPAAVWPRPQRLASVIVQPTSASRSTSPFRTSPPAILSSISAWRWVPIWHG